MKKIVPEIHSYVTTDIDEIWNWKPENPESVYYALDIEIGPKDELAGQTFRVIISTLESLKKMRRINHLLVPKGRGILVFSDYHWNEVIRKIEQIIESCAADSWEKVVANLRQYFFWEYELEFTQKTATLPILIKKKYL